MPSDCSCVLALAVVCALLIVDSLRAQPAGNAPDKEPFHPTRVLVKFAAQEQVAGRMTALQQRRLKIHRQFRLLPRVAVLDLEDENEVKAAQALAPTDRTKRLQERIAELRSTGLFEYVEPDYIRTINVEPNDSAFTDGRLWALRNLGQNGGTNGADIGATAAWNITTGSTNVIVAVVDTGIRYTHQDLTNQMWRNPGESGGGKETNGIDDDGDGYIDNVHGINATAMNSAAGGDPMDDSVDQNGNPLGHGTHVAGTIGAAANNGFPHVGVAWKVRLMACKLFDASGSGSEAFVSDEIECFQFALTNGARVINASYGGYYYSQSEYEAVKLLRDHGVLLVAAAGNDEWNNDSFLAHYPSSYDLHNIIAVAAVDRFDNLADFSNYGKTTVHLGAPGVEIFSSVNASNSAYATFKGTSMATPHVVGAAALVLSQFPTATLTEVRRSILDGAVPIPSLTNKTATGGRLNAFNSLVAASTGTLSVEVFPRPGSPFAAGRSATLSAVVSDLLPVTNATVIASIAGFTNLTLMDDGSAPDAVQADGVYSADFLVPTNLTTLEITLTVSASGWPTVTNLFSYPVVFPPSNDNFASRIPIPPSNCISTATGSNLNASKEPGEPIHANRPDGRSVWWSWTAPFTGSVKMSTAGSSFDTLLSVYAGQTVSNLVQIAANDDAGGYDLHSAVRFNAVAGIEYQIAIDGFVAQQGGIVLGVLPLTSSVTFAEAVDNYGLLLTSGGDESWLGQSCVFHYGADAARSGPIDAYRQSWMEAVIPVPGMLTFWWKVSSEANKDYLRFAINGVEQSLISGEMDWNQQSYLLKERTNTLLWIYTKNLSVNHGQDAGWVDEVLFESVQSTIPAKSGDLDADRQPTVLDLTLLIGYLADTNGLLPQIAVFADVNGDGSINSNDISALADAILGRTTLLPAPDNDGDGIPDVLELLMGLDPTEPDSDNNGTPDAQEDFDYDGMTTARELLLGTDPWRRDTDDDGWWDEPELAVGSNPLDANSRPFVMAVSAPRVTLLLPADPPVGSLNTVVASPPITLLLPADPPAGGLTNNTVIAMPPVSIELQSP